MARTPAAPAIPAPTTPVGRDAPPEEELELPEVAAAVVAAALVVSLVREEVPVAEAVPLLYFPVAVELERGPPVTAPVGAAAPAAVRK
jgi:hypothetical protein